MCENSDKLNRSDCLALMREINANMIATDNKFAQLSIAHNATTIAVIGFFVSTGMRNLEYGFVVPFASSIFSWITITGLSRLQGWKEHYYSKMKELLDMAGIVRDDRYMPRWLVDKKPKRLHSTGIVSQFIPFCVWLVSLALSVVLVGVSGQEISAKIAEWAIMGVLQALLLLFWVAGKSGNAAPRNVSDGMAR